MLTSKEESSLLYFEIEKERMSFWIEQVFVDRTTVKKR